MEVAEGRSGELRDPTSVYQAFAKKTSSQNIWAGKQGGEKSFKEESQEWSWTAEDSKVDQKH